MKQWRVLYRSLEVVPIDDVREHVLRRVGDCWCEPTTDLFGVLIHNSADERELFETGERKPS